MLRLRFEDPDNSRGTPETARRDTVGNTSPQHQKVGDWHGWRTQHTSNGKSGTHSQWWEIQVKVFADWVRTVHDALLIIIGK